MYTIERRDSVEGALSTVFQSRTRRSGRSRQTIVWYLSNDARSLRWCHGCFGGHVSFMRMVVVGIDVKWRLRDRLRDRRGKIFDS